MPPTYRIRKQPQHSMSKAAALFGWLFIIALIAACMYWAQQQRQSELDPQTEAEQAVARLNEIRRQVGAPPFTHSPQLAQSAQKHADYLSLDGEDAHDEHNRANPHFSGTELGERTEHAGYFSNSSENLITTSYRISGERGTDELMTALYHRLNLLDPDYDEIGVGWAYRNYGTVVFNQGNRHSRQLCHDKLEGKNQDENEGEYTYAVYCKDELAWISSDQAPAQLPAYIVYPVGSNIEPAYNGDESPNPMPGYSKTGNPLSISFHGEKEDIEVVSFKLFGPEGEVQPTHIMTADNDPNAVLAYTEFALFPLKPLQFAADYRAEFRYRSDDNEAVQTVNWTFRTRDKRSWFE